MEEVDGRKKALYELHKSTGASHDSGDDDSVELFKEQWPSATLKECTREVDLNGTQWQERRTQEDVDGTTPRRLTSRVTRAQSVAESIDELDARRTISKSTRSNRSWKC